MSSTLYPNEPVIDDGNWNEAVLGGELGSRGRGYGLTPRSFGVYPKEFLGVPAEITLIPQSEWSARIKELEETQSRLSDIRGNIPSLDQGSNGYCWAHSTVHALTLVRQIANQPYVPLSAYMVAAIIKDGKNEGGWCGLSAKFLQEVGVAPQSSWPQGNRDTRLDTPLVRALAANHKVLEGWDDFSQPVWDQQLSFNQVMTLLLTRTPVALDFNWWGHSVCGLDPVEVEPGSFGIRIWNSWGDSWGTRGMGVLRGTQAIPNAAVGIRTSRPTLS